VVPGETIMFGGLDGAGTALAETWRFNPCAPCVR